jgi:hypothetical protein
MALKGAIVASGFQGGSARAGCSDFFLLHFYDCLSTPFLLDDNDSRLYVLLNWIRLVIFGFVVGDSYLKNWA